MGQREDDIELFRSLSAAYAPPQQAARPSQVESSARGALQGVTSGLGDEIAAGIETGASKIPGLRSVAQWMQPAGAPRADDPNVTYAERRDYKRAQNLEAQAANPQTYTGANMAGGVAQMAVLGPYAKALGAGAGATGALLRGGAQGAAAGFGYSDEKGLRLVGDAIKGAGVGAALSVPGAVAGAPLRADQRLVNDFGKGAGLKAQRALEGAGPEAVAGTARDFGIGRPGAAASRTAARAATADVGGKIGEAYKAIDSVNMPAPMDRVGAALAGIEAKLSARSTTAEMAGPVAALREDLAKRYGGNIPISALNEEIGNLEAKGFAGNTLNPKAAPGVQRATARALETVMQDSIKQAAGTPGATNAARALPDLNSQYRTLKTLRDITEKRVPQDSFKTPKAGVRAAIGGAAEKVDEFVGAGARKAGDLPGAAAAGIRSLSPQVMDAVTGGDRRKAIELLGQEVYGD